MDYEPPVAEGAGSKMLEVPEPSLTPDEIIGRARALRDRLRDEQAATEERTYYSAELHEEFSRSGFYRMPQPRRFGGYEFTLPTFFRTIIELARGCPGTGWCVCLGAGHVLAFASQCSEDAQVAAFGDSGHFIAPSRPLPTGTATPTADGWLINGRWDYCSGVPYATHIFNMVKMPPAEDGSPRVGMALVPRADVTVVEDWGDAIGLCGSGSHTTIVENVEVPHGFVAQRDPDQDPSQQPGYKIHGNSMYAGRRAAFAVGELVACAIGMARAGMDECAAQARTKTTVTPPFGLRSDDPQYQQWIGRALMLADCAEAALLHVGELYHEFCHASVNGGEPFTFGKDFRLMSLTAQAGVLATDALDLLIRTGGTSAMKNGARMQRYWRDMSTFRSHVAHQHQERDFTESGAAYLSGESTDSLVQYRPPTAT